MLGALRLGVGLGTLGTLEGSVARLLARKLRRISKELTATNQKFGAAQLSDRCAAPPCETWRLANASHGRHERRPVPSRALERHGRTWTRPAEN